MNFQEEHDRIIAKATEENKVKIAKGMSDTEFYVMLSRAMTEISKIVNDDGYSKTKQIIREVFHER